MKNYREGAPGPGGCFLGFLRQGASSVFNGAWSPLPIPTGTIAGAGNAAAGGAGKNRDERGAATVLPNIAFWDC